MQTRKILTSVFALLVAGQIYAAPYSRFIVEGNERISDTVVLGVAGLTPGVTVGDAQVNQAVQRLYDSGLFGEVSVSVNDGTVVFTVVENAIISGIYFEGNTKFEDERLDAVVSLEPRDGLDRAKIDEDVQSIRRFYAANSRFNVEVEPVVISEGNGRYKLIYEIDEGSTSEVEQISFTGNREVSDWRLRRIVTTRESGFLSSIFRSDDFANERLQEDSSRLLEYYQNSGYYTAEVKAVQADYDAAGNFYVDYQIFEGQRFRVGNIVIDSEIPGVNGEDFRSELTFKSGQWFDRSKFTESFDKIEELAERRGLPFLRVVPDVTTNEVTATLDVRLLLQNGEREYVERIDIRGNDTTIDRVIRREFDVVEGDPLNQRKINEAREAIERLGYFGSVNLAIREGSAPDQKIVDVDLEEANTGALSLGASYSTDDSWGFNFNYSERNFLGLGQTVVFDLVYGANTKSGKISYVEPRLFDRNVLGGIDLFYSNGGNSAAGYSTIQYGVEPRLGFRTSDDSYLNLGVFAYNEEIDETFDNVSPIIQAEVDPEWVIGAKAEWTINKTDNFSKPKRGWLLRLGAEYAGLGGDRQWSRYSAKAKYYTPVFSDLFIFSIEGEVGHVAGLNGDDVRVTDRYFLGGAQTLKGFESGGLGPRDVLGDVDSSLGGKNLAAVRAQLQVPLGSFLEDLGLSGALFYETGSVWGLDNTSGASGTIDDDLYWRASRGVSVLWDLGQQTISFNWADPYQAESYDKTQEFSVSAQASF